jgi:LuxR family transcriptional regulator, maltose regulon positive regulatory protein
MQDIQWLCRAALEYMHRQDVQKALQQLQMILSRHEAFDDSQPEYRIYTFGKFVVVKADGVISFMTGTQRMPLELLKVILAFGGLDVSIQSICGVLWPEAEGDAAHACFKVALHRLRRLMGSSTVLSVRDDTVTLDQEQVWVDAWTFERWFNALNSSRGVSENDDETAAREMLRLYKGPFMGAAAPAAAIRCRERLRSKFIRGVMMLGHHCERKRAWREAVEVYEQGIDADAVAEDLYQRLIVCHRELGQVGHAVDAYRRCQASLDAILNTTPARKTQSLCQSVRAQSSPLGLVVGRQ